MASDLKMLRPPLGSSASLPATPPGTAADPAEAFSCFVMNAVHGI
jgi:hypothetical protein